MNDRHRAGVASASRQQESGATPGSRIAALASLGQQIWLDKLSRSLVQSGELQRWVEEHAIAGVTSNPAIFAQALTTDPAYAAALAELRSAEPDRESRFEQLAIPDVQAACDVLLPLYESTQGDAGYVSFEVSPRLSRDGPGTLAAARRLWAQINRPNAMIKIPATLQCMEAVSAALSEGININVTLMFSPQHARQVFAACTKGLQQGQQAGRPLNKVRSVASIFVSRLDTAVDARLPAAEASLRGETGIANARSCYALWSESFGGSAFAELRAAGARPPACLWASTGNKNPAYSDVRYVEALAGPGTVNTVPEATLQAFADHGEARRTLDTGIPAAQALIAQLESMGLDLDAIGEDLQKDGLLQFEQAFDKLLQAVA
jgi:transaldolase